MSSVYTPERFGAVADGVTDDSTAIQAAIDACDVNRGGEVHFRAEKYAIRTGLTVTKQGTVLVGCGMPGAAGANGSSRIIVASGITGITFGAAGHGTLGYGLRCLHVIAAPGATTGNGVVVQNAENFICEDVNVSGFVGGAGLTIDGKAGNAQYAMLVNFCAGDNLRSLHLKGLAPNGARMFGGYLAAGTPSGGFVTPRVGSVGVHVETGDSFRMFGTVIQGYETGLYIQTQAKGHELHGPRFEFCNINLRVGGSARNVSLFGGTMTNSLLRNNGAGNIGIQIDAGAADVFLSPTAVDGCVTAIADAGTRTIVQGQYAARINA